eukprot:5000918-Alexandrium_andersonii.AAC.1
MLCSTTWAPNSGSNLQPLRQERTRPDPVRKRTRGRASSARRQPRAGTDEQLRMSLCTHAIVHA